MAGTGSGAPGSRSRGSAGTLVRVTTRMAGGRAAAFGPSCATVCTMLTAGQWSVNTPLARGRGVAGPRGGRARALTNDQLGAHDKPVGWSPLADRADERPRGLAA